MNVNELYFKNDLHNINNQRERIIKDKKPKTTLNLGLTNQIVYLTLELNVSYCFVNNYIKTIL